MLGDGGADTIDESENKGYVDGTGDFAAVGKIEGCELGDELGECFLGEGGGKELGLGSHRAMCLEMRSRSARMNIKEDMVAIDRCGLRLKTRWRDWGMLNVRLLTTGSVWEQAEASGSNPNSRADCRLQMGKRHGNVRY